MLRKHNTPKDRIQIIKGIHGWRPTKRRLHVINKKRKTTQQEDTTDLCPLCKEHQETQNHIFQCPQKQARINRTKGLRQIKTYCQTRDTFPPVTDIITKNLQKWMNTETIPPQTDITITSRYRTTQQETTELLTAINNQTKIGWEQILHGRISLSWEKIATKHWTKKDGTWTPGFIRQTVKLSTNIWLHRVENEFGFTEQSREQYMQTQLRPRIEQAYTNTETVSQYHNHLLRIPLARRLLLPSKTNKRWLQHIASAKASYKRHQMKTLLSTPKITTFFLPKKTKTYHPNPTLQQMPHKKQKQTEKHIPNKKQQTLTGQQYKLQINHTELKKKPNYHKRQYATITNYIEGPQKTTLHKTTFLEKPVILSNIRVPYINRKNKKYKISSTNNQIT